MIIFQFQKFKDKYPKNYPDFFDSKMPFRIYVIKS